MLPRFFQSSVESAPQPRRLSALMLAVVFTIIACLWIVLSDRMLLLWAKDQEQFARWETYKGWAFVAFSALMLFFERTLNERESKRIDRILQQRVDEHTAALELSRAQLQVIMNHAPVIFYMRDVEGRYIWVNRRWEQQTGHTAEEAIGATPSMLFVPETAAEIQENQRRVLERNEAAVEEVTLLLLDEPHVFVRAIFPLTTSEGEIYALAGILTDITEQRRVEESLRAAEARYRTLFDVAVVGISIVNDDGHYVNVNPALAAMLGYEAATLESMTCWDVTAPEDTSNDSTLFAQIVAGETDRYEVEKQYCRADGTVFWAGLTMSVLQRNDDEGLYLAVCEDITERHAMEVARRRMQEELAEQVAVRTSELRRVNDELAEAQRIAHVGSWSLDLYADEFVGSAETSRIFGLEADEFAGDRTTMRSFIHPDDLARVTESARAAFTTGTTLDIEFRVVRPDGSCRFVQLRGNALYADDGTPARLFGSMQDITEEKEAELALREVNRHLSALIEASPLAILVVRTDGTITHWNAAAERIYGYASEDILNQSVDMLTAPETVALEEQRTATEQGRSFNDLETQRIRADGTVIDVSISTAPIYDEAGNVASVVAVVADITERKATEAQLRILNQELEKRVAERTQHLEQEIMERKRVESEVLELNRTLAEQAGSLAAINKELETFTYSVSHDLKAPLRGIDGYSRLLQEDHANKLDEDALFFIQSIRRASGHMAQLIDDLLAYSRIERRRLHAGPINLADLVDTLISQIKHEMPHQQVKIVKRLEIADVHSDPGALSFALRNLIDNAIKFSIQNETPCVKIASHPTEDGWQIYVKDNGIGFDMQYCDRIFDIFQRLHRAEDYPGTGIGLAIVRKAVQRLQGRVWAESVVGEGATFYMEFEHEPTEQADPTH